MRANITEFWSIKEGLSLEADDRRKINLLESYLEKNNNYYAIFNTGDTVVTSQVDDYLLTRGNLNCLNKLLGLLDFITLKQFVSYLQIKEVQIDGYEALLKKHATIEHLHSTFKIIKHTPSGQHTYAQAIKKVFDIATRIAPHTEISVNDTLCASMDYLSMTYGKGYTKVYIDLFTYTTRYLTRKDEGNEQLQQALAHRAVNRSVKYAKNTQQLLTRLFGVQEEYLPHLKNLIDGLIFDNSKPGLSTYTSPPGEIIFDIYSESRDSTDRVRMMNSLLSRILLNILEQKHDCRTIYATTAFIFYASKEIVTVFSKPILLNLTAIILQNQAEDKRLCYKTVAQLLMTFLGDSDIPVQVAELAYQYKNQMAINVLMDYFSGPNNSHRPHHLIDLAIEQSRDTTNDYLSTIISLIRQTLQNQGKLDQLLPLITPQEAGDLDFTTWVTTNFDSDESIKQVLIGLVSQLNLMALTPNERKIFTNLHLAILTLTPSHNKNFLFLFYTTQLNHNFTQLFFQLRLYFNLSENDLLSTIFQLLQYEALQQTNIKAVVEIFTKLSPELLQGTDTNIASTHGALFTLIQIFSRNEADHSQALSELLQPLTNNQLANFLDFASIQAADEEDIPDNGKLFFVTLCNHITQTHNAKNAPYTALLFKAMKAYWALNARNKDLVYNIHFTLDNWGLPEKTLYKISASLLYYTIDQHTQLEQLNPEESELILAVIKKTFSAMAQLSNINTVMKCEYIKPCYNYFQQNIPNTLTLLNTFQLRKLSTLSELMTRERLIPYRQPGILSRQPITTDIPPQHDEVKSYEHHTPRLPFK